MSIDQTTTTEADTETPATDAADTSTPAAEGTADEGSDESVEGEG